MKVTRKINRPDPVGPAHAYQTYAVRAPLTTHWRKATCPEVQCEAYLKGWTIRVQHIDPDLIPTLKASGRKYTRMDLTADEGYLVFEPGQRCFQEPQHRLRLERPEFFYVGRGDHRLFNPRNAQELKSEHWVEHLYGHLDLLHRKNQRG